MIKDHVICKSVRSSAFKLWHVQRINISEIQMTSSFSTPKMMLENTIDDLHHLEKMILQSQLVTQRLMSQKKAVQALHSLIQRIATGEGPRIDWSSIKYAFSCRYSYSSSSLDLRQVPVESYTLMVRYMTSTSLKELGAAQHLFRKAVVWLRGHPMHRDWQKIENCVRKEHSEWAILFRRGKVS